MTDIDIAVLKAAAKAATPGPWHYQPPDDDDAHVPWSYVWGPSIRSLGGSSRPQDDADRAFIAAADPTAVLALIERLERAETKSEEKS